MQRELATISSLEEIVMASVRFFFLQGHRTHANYPSLIECGAWEERDRCSQPNLVRSDAVGGDPEAIHVSEKSLYRGMYRRRW
jgi:hypothetical protein